jgi:hypothetical protein
MEDVDWALFDGAFAADGDHFAVGADPFTDLLFEGA